MTKNKLVPFSKIVKTKNGLSVLSKVSVVMDEKNTLVGFVFGRDSFINFLENIDTEFENKVKNPTQAYNNLAGKLIDLIEGSLPVSPHFVKDLRDSMSGAKKYGWIPFDQVMKALHV